MRQDRIIGGVCYRPYYDQRFAEIAFLAINSNEQVKGYGSILMNQLKHHVQKERIEYFLTYADNFAIGYFQKQGFSKQVVMPKERWQGFIKDYDGGTLMECYIHPGMDYLNVSAIVAAQRQFILDRVKELQQSDVLHSGLDTLLAQSGGRIPSLLEVPGVAVAGWTSSHLYRGATDRDRNSAQNKLTGFLKALLDKVRGFREAPLFLQPLPQSELPAALGQYTDMGLSLSLISSRVRAGDYYKCKEALQADLHRMTTIWSHCGTDSPERAAVEAMNQQVDELFRDMQLKDYSLLS